MDDWKSTRLWQELNSDARKQREPETDKIVALLNLVMGDVETTLSSAATSPLPFTLHDDRHAFRVAERMAEIVQDSLLADLTSYEMAFLLLSAYLHDIGMTPEQARVQSHYAHVLNATASGLSATDVEELTQWANFRGVELPLATPDAVVSNEQLRLADSLTAHYCRHRHNDWSEAWIRDKFKMYADSFETYSSWIDDLVALCRSHHYGYRELSQGQRTLKPFL